MKHILTSFVIFAALTGCSLVPNGLKRPADVDQTNAPVTVDAGVLTRPLARPTDAVPATALPDVAKPAAVSGALGNTVASLGSPAEPGLWLKTPLVNAQSSGKVTYKGKSIDVTLIPIDGPKTAGSRMSLQGFQALGAPLTELVEVQVST